MVGNLPTQFCQRFMEVIRTDILDSFAFVHNQSRRALDTWLTTTKRNNWQSLLDIKKIYNGGVKGKYTVFNIAGNKYRLIVVISYEDQTVAITDILTHAQYSSTRG